MYLGSAMSSFRPGTALKTPKMRGYVKRVDVASKSADPGSAELMLPEGDPERSSFGEADFVFDAVFFENDSWADADADSKGTYAFRCWQKGGSQSSQGDSRAWRVCATSRDATADSDGSFVPQPQSASAFSDMKLDAQLFELFLSSDWESMDVADYESSLVSVRRW